MQLFAVVSAALALFTAVSAAPAQLKTVQKYAGETKPSSYIVKLKEGVSKDAHLAWLAENHGASATVTHPEWQEDFLNGFAGECNVVASDATRTACAVP